MRSYRLTPLALALLCLFPAGARAATSLPSLLIDPALLAPAAVPRLAIVPRPEPAPVAVAPQPAPAPATVAAQPAPIPATAVMSQPAPASAAPQPAPEPATSAPPVPAHTAGLQATPLPPAEIKRPAATAIATNPSLFITAVRIQGHQDAEIEADGDVELRKEQQRMYADHMRYDQPTDELYASGKVRVEQNGDIIKGPELWLKLEPNKGYMQSPKYWLAEEHAWGDADKLLFEGKNQYRMETTRYTTCPIGADDWFLRSRELELNRTTQLGNARDARIEFHGVPLLYTPWFSFSLNKQRKSGFLTPSFGTTGRSGVEISTPYYWNIAPNYDATITPRLIGKRGIQVNTEFRYLEPTFLGEVHYEVLPSDRLANINRYALTLNHQQSLGGGWNGGLDIQKVSDDTYYRDLSTVVTSTAQTNLPRQAALSYSGGPWSFNALVQRFQTLQDQLAPVVPPFHRAPQFSLIYNRANLHGADLNVLSEFTNFYHPTQVNGKRVVLYPSASFPLTQPFGYITPKVGLHLTRYSLDKTTTTLPDSSRSVPIFSLDSGLAFERDISLGQAKYLQTLEPRLFYVYVPYRDQSQLPIFDSGLTDFNSQIFSENQWSGNDRINDANQVTLGITSRLIESASGQERVSATVGQRYYFSELTTPAHTYKTSDIVASLNGKITPHWSVEGGLQYNPHLKLTEKANAGMLYQPETGKLLSLNYRFTRDTLKQFDVSTQWPLASNWYGVARWNYSLLDHRILESLAGVEYNRGCWAARFVVHRFATATQESTNSIFLQLELTGISSIGANPFDVLRQTISGYTKPNPLPTGNQANEF